METSLIFIAGVHGVGKSTFCRELAGNQSDFDYLSASDLISKYKANAFTSSKKVKAVSDNQDVLLRAYEAYQPKGIVTLLDGHFCLLNSSYRPVAISQNIFQKLGIKMIVLLTASIATISERMSQRGIHSLPDNVISDLQALEVESAKSISENLNLPSLLFDEEQLTMNLQLVVSQTKEAIQRCEYY